MTKPKRIAHVAVGLEIILSMLVFGTWANPENQQSFLATWVQVHALTAGAVLCFGLFITACAAIYKGIDG